MLQSLSPEDAQVVVRLFGELLIEAVGELLPQRIEGIQNALGMSKEVSSLASRLARQYHMSRSDVLLKALGLLKLAMDARSNEHRVAILDQDDGIVQEIVGFEPSGAPLQPTAK